LHITLPLDGVNALWDRRTGETFETLHRDGATTGRLLVLHLHPWLIGQPFRIGCLDDALRRQGVTGTEIIDWYRSPPTARPSPGRSSLSLSLTGAGVSRPLRILATQLVQHLGRRAGRIGHAPPRGLAGGPPVGPAWGPRRSVASKHPTRYNAGGDPDTWSTPLVSRTETMSS
jgi:hypothetical protein